jgi:hypothetical protein
MAGGAMRFINMHDGTGDEHSVFQNHVVASADEKPLFAHKFDGPAIRAGVCSPSTARILFMQLNGAYFAMHKVRAFL